MARPTGRPSGLTPAVVEGVARVLPAVLYVGTLADYLGVGRSTLYSRGWPGVAGRPAGCPARGPGPGRPRRSTWTSWTQ
jgi:hypothetical protein